MRMPRRRHRSRPVIGLLALLVPFMAGLSFTAGAAADTPSNPATTVATTATQTNVAPNGPLTGLSDLSNIHVVISAAVGTLTGTEVRLCKGGVNIINNSQFVPLQGGNCILNPITAGSDAYLVPDPDVTLSSVTFDFKVGVGTTNWATPSGNKSVTCDSANPCALWMKQQVGPATYYVHYDLDFAGGGPTTPGAPTGVAGTPGDTSVAVTWTAPASNGGAAIDGYTVTSNPDNKTCTWTSGPLTCTVTGLTNGVPYTFVAKAHNSVGFGPDSIASSAVTPTAVTGAYFHPLSPVRILDSRTATGGWSAKLNAGTPKNLQVTGVTGVPGGAVAAVMNITVTGGSNNSFLTAYPAGVATPNASNVNFAVGQTIPNLATVKIGTGGQVAFANAVGSVDVIADLVGYYDNVVADKFNPLSPVRILDSRTATGGWSAKLNAGTPKNLQVIGAGGVPVGADAVIMNVTVTGGSNNSFLTAYPAGVATPNASNVNFAAGETIPNLVTVKIGTGGQVAFANAVGSVDVIADVVGFYNTTTGDVFHALSPARILDSRTATGGWSAKLNAGTPKTLQVTGAGGVPVGADAIIGNTTVTGGTNNSFVTVYPAGVATPNASNVNFAAGQTIPNLTAVKIGTGGQVAFANAVGATDVIFDVVGYFAAS